MKRFNVLAGVALAALLAFGGLTQLNAIASSAKAVSLLTASNRTVDHAGSWVLTGVKTNSGASAVTGHSAKARFSIECGTATGTTTPTLDGRIEGKYTANGVVYPLVSFTQITTSVASETKTVDGPIPGWIRFFGDLGGTGPTYSCTVDGLLQGDFNINNY